MNTANSAYDTVDEQFWRYIFRSIFRVLVYFRASKLAKWLKKIYQRHCDRHIVANTIPHRGDILLLHRYDWNQSKPDECTGVYRVPVQGLLCPSWLSGHNYIMPGSLVVEFAKQTAIALVVRKYNLNRPIIGEDFAVVDEKNNRFFDKVRAGNKLYCRVRLQKVRVMVGSTIYRFSYEVSKNSIFSDDAKVASGSFDGDQLDPQATK